MKIVDFTSNQTGNHFFCTLRKGFWDYGDIGVKKLNFARGLLTPKGRKQLQSEIIQ
jgi:hypothetical protein